MYQVGLLTVSDRCHSGLREDMAGEFLAESLPVEFFHVRRRTLCPDDEGMIADELLAFCEAGCDLILTVGGIGFAPRDVTPEATVSVLDKNAPGIAELLRRGDAGADASLLVGLSLNRGVAGIHEQTLIVNLPGTREGVRDAFRRLLPVLPRAMEALGGDDFLPNRKTS